MKVTSLPKFEIRRTLRSISSQVMDHGWELTSDSETGDQHKISLGPNFRYPSRVTFHVTLKMAKKVVIIKLNEAISLYVIWIELDETYPTI